jgi:hypothetical protein
VTLYGLDVSNFNSMQYRGTAEYQNAQFIIAQAIPRPAPNRALAVLDEWAIERELPLAGIYWSRYFIDLLFGGVNYWPERKQWLAHYGITPGSLIGGSVVAHQYSSTPIDQNMMLESEIVNGEEPMPDCSDLVNGLAYVADDLGDKLLAEAKRSSVRKTVVRNIVKEMERVRVEQVGPRPT